MSIDCVLSVRWMRSSGRGAVGALERLRLGLALDGVVEGVRRSDSSGGGLIRERLGSGRVRGIDWGEECGGGIVNEIGRAHV